MQTVEAVPSQPSIGVIALVPDEWESHWQARHHVMSRLARHFQVVWMNPPRHWKQAFVAGSKKQDPHGGTGLHSFTVYDPAIPLPKFYRPRFLDELSSRLRLRGANRILTRLGCKMKVLYIWRPDFRSALKLAEYDLACYHIDDEYSFSPVELPLNPVETALIREVDQVFVHSPGLFERKGGLNPNTLLVSNGVDYQAHASPVPEMNAIAHIPHPRIGYTGWIKKQLDWDLLLRLSSRHPGWSFVFVGGRSPHPDIAATIARMEALDNVHFLGARPSHEIAQYPQHFDVCIMPYKIDDYTKYIFPMKLNEYLASGRPVVGSRIRSLEAFSDLIGLAETPDEWSAEIRKSLESEENTPERGARRQAMARRHDWMNVVNEIAAALASRIMDQHRSSFPEAADGACTG